MTAETLLVLAAACAAAAALALGDPRRRGIALLAAPALAAAALGVLVAEQLADALSGRAALAAVAGAAGLAALLAAAWLVHRRPGALVLLALAALPFRVPISVGGETASLLVGLYGVIAAGCLAHAATLLRGRPVTPGTVAADHPPVRRLLVVLGAVVVLYAAQALYSTDTEQAVKNACFFYVPFAVLLRLLLDAPWTARVVRDLLWLTVGLAMAFAAIGLVEWATGELVVSNAKVIEANEIKPYFRVNSLFFDPNVYGRFLAVAMTVLAAVLVWTRRPRAAAGLGLVLAFLWTGLVPSLSQSSFGALLAGLAVLAAIRWRPLPVVGAIAVALALSVAVVLLAPGAVGVETGSQRALDRSTSGRIALVEGALTMARDRPVWGFGSGSFAERYRVREGVRSETQAAISHTTPLTIAAEQGAIGLVGYAALLWAALALLFAGVRQAVRAPGGDLPPAEAVGRVAVAAAFCGLVLHTLVYAAFLEDPLTWALLAAGGALAARGAGARGSAAGGGPQADPADRRGRTDPAPALG